MAVPRVVGTGGQVHQPQHHLAGPPRESPAPSTLSVREARRVPQAAPLTASTSGVCCVTAGRSSRPADLIGREAGAVLRVADEQREAEQAAAEERRDADEAQMISAPTVRASPFCSAATFARGDLQYLAVGATSPTGPGGCRARSLRSDAFGVNLGGRWWGRRPRWLRCAGFDVPVSIRFFAFCSVSS